MIPLTPKNQTYHSHLNDEPVKRLSITISFEINEEEEVESETDFSADLRNMDESASYSTPKPTSSSSLKLRKKAKTQHSISSEDAPRYITPDLMMPSLDEPPKMMRCASSFSSRNNQERENEDDEVILRNILPSISFEEFFVLRNKELPSSSSLLLSRRESHKVPKLSNEITILPQRSKSIDLNTNTSKRKPLSSDIPSHLLMPTF